MPPPDTDAKLAAIHRIAREVTASHAREVDRDARFPHETIDALREERLLAIAVPDEVGGPGWNWPEILATIRVLGGQDASVGLILCMHLSQIVVLSRHASNDAQLAFLRQIHDDQLLIANANSEMNVAGDDRRSNCAVSPQPDGRFALTKDSPVISYGEYADAFFVTARAGAEAAPTDQVIAICRAMDTTLTPLGPWDAMGLRGSCSRPFHLEATGDVELVMADYGNVVSQTGLPITNQMFAHFWLGMAESCVSTAHTFIRKRHRGKPDQAALPLLRLAELAATLDKLRGVIAFADATVNGALDTPEIESLGVAARLQDLKVNGTTLLTQIAMDAMALCGIPSYVNTSEFSLARQVRDAIGARLMVSNDSMLGQNASMLLLRKEI